MKLNINDLLQAITHKDDDWKYVLKVKEVFPWDEIIDEKVWNVDKIYNVLDKEWDEYSIKVEFIN